MHITVYMALLLLQACNVHEWPEQPDQMPVQIALDYEKVNVYDTGMTPWNHEYDGSDVVEQGYGEKYDQRIMYGIKRYIIRAYPVSQKRSRNGYAQEMIIEKDIEHGYEHETVLHLQPGEYDIMVWSDMKPVGRNEYYYNTDNFAEIRLQGEHQGNCNWRDAFSGSTRISFDPSVVEGNHPIIEVDMHRPLAKFEFVTNDLQDFVDKELKYLAQKAATRGEIPPTRLNIDDYKVVFYYSGYMPDTYNMHTDKPVDASTGIMFSSKLEVLNNREASLGFDYVFVNGKNSVVTVQVGLYDKEDRQLALSEPINVPLQRNYHTVLRGSFLMNESSGGINISPEFDGNHNITIE